jgi:protein tyrosine/serine phosphatase
MHMDAPFGAKPRSSWRTWVINLTLAALLTGFLWKVGYIYLVGNVYEVIPGRLYRGGQPSGESLERLIARYKIRTVLNMRACNYPERWYVSEAEACARHGVSLLDLNFSAVRMPSRHELRKLVEALDAAETPIFVHCRHGADRSGLASMVALLLLEEYSFETAQGQLGLRYGHIPFGKTTMLDRFMQHYSDWLAASNQAHTPQRFRHWILNEYRGADCDAHFESVKRRFEVPRVRKALEYDVVVRNTGDKAWQFRVLKGAGHHVTFKLVNDENQTVHEGRAGMLERTVPPGATIAVVLTVPPQAMPGRYRFYIDMIEEGHCWFYQTGSELWEEELDIRE